MGWVLVHGASSWCRDAGRMSFACPITLASGGAHGATSTTSRGAESIHGRRAGGPRLASGERLSGSWTRG